MAIGTRLRELAAVQGDRDAIVDESGACSYRRFHERICRFGNALRGLGLAAGDRVALLMPDVREYLEADYAIMSAGLVRVPLDPRSTRADLVALLRHAGARALVTHRSLAEAFDGLSREVESLAHVVIVGGGDGHDYEALLARASDAPLPDPDPDALATLNFSGGTTGAPKATMLRHRNLQAVADATMRGFEIAGDAMFLNVRPLWPIAQVILMSHLYRRRDRGAAAIPTGALRRDGRRDRRHPHVAGADATRALPRSRSAAGSAAGAARGDLCRRLAHSAANLRARARYFRAEDRRALRAHRSAGDLLHAAARARRSGTSRCADRRGGTRAARIRGAARRCRRGGRRIRRSSHSRRQRHGRLLAGRGGHARPRCATAGCTPATSVSSTATAFCRSSGGSRR